MRIKDLTTVLNKLEKIGFGDAEIYTECDDSKASFVLYLNGINEDDFVQAFPFNPFINNAEIYSFGISKEMSIVEKDCKVSDCFDLWYKMTEASKDAKTDGEQDAHT